MELDTWRHVSFQDLGFSSFFCEQSKKMGFEDLEAILCTTPGQLTQHASFSYQWLAELQHFLNEKKAAHLLQSIPGKNAG